MSRTFKTSVDLFHYRNNHNYSEVSDVPNWKWCWFISLFYILKSAIHLHTKNIIIILLLLLHFVLSEILILLSYLKKKLFSKSSGKKKIQWIESENLKRSNCPPQRFLIVGRYGMYPPKEIFAIIEWKTFHI